MAVSFLTPIYTSSGKRPLISDHIKGPLVAAFWSPLMKALDRSVETLGLSIVTSSVSFIKSVNQSSIKPCLIFFLFNCPCFPFVFFLPYWFSFTIAKYYSNVSIKFTTFFDNFKFLMWLLSEVVINISFHTCSNKSCNLLRINLIKWN